MHPVLVIAGSARKEGETTDLINLVFHQTSHQLIHLSDLQIAPYSYSNTYAIHDGFLGVMQAAQQHQVIVFATPVYWYAMSGLMKLFFDRLTDIVTVQKNIGRSLKGKTIFLLSAGADADLPAGFEVPFASTASYLDMRYGGCLYHSTKYPKAEKEMFHNINHFLLNIQAANTKPLEL